MKLWIFVANWYYFMHVIKKNLRAKTLFHEANYPIHWAAPLPPEDNSVNSKVSPLPLLPAVTHNFKKYLFLNAWRGRGMYYVKFAM